MRKIALFFSLIFLGCAVTQKKIEVVTPEKMQEVKEEMALVKADSIRDLKEIIKESRFYSEKGRILFYSSMNKKAVEVKKKLLRQFPNSLATEEIGFEDFKKEDIIFQLDSRNIPIFVSIDLIHGDEIILEITSVENGEKELKKVLCPFLKDKDGKDSYEFILNIKTFPESVCWAQNKEIIITDGKKISVVNIEEMTEKTIDLFVCEGLQISNFGEGAVFFCPQTGKGFKFEKKDGKYEKNERAGFPLPERAMRFISVEKDESGFWALFDRKDEILGEFVSLSKYIFRETTVLLAISPKGELWGLRGDLIEPIYSKEKVTFRKVCSSNNIAYGLSQNGDLYKINIESDFSIVPEKKQVNIFEKIINIAAVGDELYLFTKSENTIKLYEIYQNGD